MRDIQELFEYQIRMKLDLKIPATLIGDSERIKYILSSVAKRAGERNNEFVE
jgi:hypothetical protein